MCSENLQTFLSHYHRKLSTSITVSFLLPKTSKNCGGILEPCKKKQKYNLKIQHILKLPYPQFCDAIRLKSSIESVYCINKRILKSLIERKIHPHFPSPTFPAHIFYIKRLPADAIAQKPTKILAAENNNGLVLYIYGAVMKLPLTRYTNTKHKIA